MLEFYEGITLLTINRIDNIDAAFHSRIHMTIRYPSLDVESQRQIWNNLLGRDSSVTSDEVGELAKLDFNGRIIKNVLKTAQILAQSEDTHETFVSQAEHRSHQDYPCDCAYHGYAKRRCWPLRNTPY